MKIKSLITLSLLFVLGFSMVHEYVFAFQDDDPCTVSEYVSEIEAPSSHGDICDIHYEYHQAFLLPQVTTLPQSSDLSSNTILCNEIYQFQANLEFFRPPIS